MTLSEQFCILEGPDKRRVRIYHVLSGDYWICQTFENDHSSQSLAAATGATIEEAIHGLVIQYTETELDRVLGGLVSSFKESRDAIRRNSAILCDEGL